MLNPFPIQWLALLAYFLLRVCVGIVLLYLGKKHIQHYKELVETTTWPLFKQSHFPIVMFIMSEIIIGIMLFIGALTQYAALFLIILSTKMLVWRNRFAHTSIPQRVTYILLVGIGFSLLITGAGAFAVDLPI
jgi:uncharacterized membrane protein YphA (DoxX/SURF4 family)